MPDQQIRRTCHPGFQSGLATYMAAGASQVIPSQLRYQPMDTQYYCAAQPAILPLKFKCAGTKRLCPVEFSEHDYFYEPLVSRPKSARISSKRQDQVRIEEAAQAAAAAAAVTASAATAIIVPLPLPNVTVLEQVSLNCCGPASRQFSTTILQCCKFTSKQTQQACKGHLTVVTHKRGHLAVSCSARHQWVWCALCCNCYSGKGASPNGRQRGCTVPTHWYERDAFDTGARNHMNVHKVIKK